MIFLSKNLNIVLLDDQKSVGDALKVDLGIKIRQFFNASDLLDWVHQGNSADCYIVDIELGEEASDYKFGLDVIPGLKELDPHTPVIVYSGSKKFPDKVVRAYESGADDFADKFDDPRLLPLKIHKRIKDSAEKKKFRSISVGDFTIIKGTRSIKGPDGQLDGLSPIDIQILCELAQRPNTVVSKDFLKEECWPPGSRINDNAFHRKNTDIRKNLKQVGSLCEIKSQFGEGLYLSVPDVEKSSNQPTNSRKRTTVRAS